MRVAPLDNKLKVKLTKTLLKAYDKQVNLLENQGLGYPSLNFEIVTATKHLPDPFKQYTFRINQKYRAFCYKETSDKIFVFDINPHKY